MTNRKRTSKPNQLTLKKMVFILIPIALSYLFFELLVSTLYVKGVIKGSSSLWIFEDSGKTIQFDPIRGYRLASIPSRFARITYDTIEYVGILRGNSQGFPDRDDFSPVRSDANRFRIAVFGDSFTAAQYIEKNWPDTVEDLGRERGTPLDLLNFSVDGGGFANWWSVLMHLIRPENYDIDGIVFAVFGGDIGRRFAISEHRGYQRHMFGRVASWNPDKWPKNLEEARPYLRPLSGHIISSESFEQALQGKGYPDFQRPWRFYVTGKVIAYSIKSIARLSRFFSARMISYTSTEVSVKFELWQRKFIEQIAHFAQSKALPIFVVRIPSRNELIDKVPPKKEVLEFASLLNATFIDGSDAFEGLTEKDIRDHWLPYDGHWAQSGSERFAAFMFDFLQKWVQDFK